MGLTASTRISDLLARYPFLVDFLAGYSPRFGLLKNRAMRATMGRVATLEKVASVGGVPLQQLLDDLAAEIAARTGEAPEAPVEDDATTTADRIEALKAIIGQLHDGADPGDVKAQFDALVADVAPAEIAAMEQQLIGEGLPVSEVQRLCDVHAHVFDGALDDQPPPEAPAGHPVHTCLAENETITALADRLAALAPEIGEGPACEAIDEVLQQLASVDNHYVRKENQLFPFLEKHDISGPSQVMWGVHDEIRARLKEARAAAVACDAAALREAVPALARMVGEMVFKENKILLPMALQTLDEAEWAEIRRGEDELGYAFAGPAAAWPEPSPSRASASQAPGSGLLDLDTGALSLEQINLMLTHLPVDLSLVDENDEVRYYSAGKERIFPRSPGVIGRKVQNCHPQKSVATVQRILDEFRAGTQDTAEFWIELGERFLHIRYLALRDAAGAYRGCLEVSQDVTAIRALQGQQRLLDWDERKAG